MSWKDWKELNEKKYTELVSGSILDNLTLNELINVAMSIDSLWMFDGAYYEIRQSKAPLIIIDRCKSGGYNNNELKVSADRNQISTIDERFKTAIYDYVNFKNEKKEKILSKFKFVLSAILKTLPNIKDIKLEDCKVYNEFTVVVLYDKDSELISCNTSEEANTIYNFLQSKIKELQIKNENDLNK